LNVFDLNRPLLNLLAYPALVYIHMPQGSA
jgi:hypothetical protein